MIDTRISYFIEVIETGSFSAAARKLYLSQPALSKGITALEDEINIQLLDRSGYRPVLTQAGKEYYDGVKALIKGYDALLESIQNSYQKKLKIAFTGLFENRHVVKVINSLEKEFKSVELSFVECSFEDSLMKLLNGEVEISFGIESTFKYNENIHYDVLFKNDICVICSFEHPFSNTSAVTVEQLKHEKFILLSKKFGNNFYRDFMDACKADQFKPHVIKEVDSFDELVLEVSIGNGIAIVSKDVVRSTEVKVIDLLNSHHSSNYVVAYLKNDDNFLQKYVNEIKKVFSTL